MRDVAVKRYSLLESADVAGLKDYLLNYVITRPKLHNPVKEQILQALAVVIKRGWNPALKEEHQAVIQSLYQLMQLDGDYSCYNALRISNALIREFSSHKSSAMGVSWEFHAMVKLSFQKELLQPLFQMALGVLQKVTQQGQDNITEAMDRITNAAISIFESVLAWDFVDEAPDKSPQHNFGHDFLVSSLLDVDICHEFPSSWHNLMVTPDFLDLVFKLYVDTLGNENADYRIGNCLVTLAALAGPIFPNADAKSAYCQHFVKHVIALFRAITDPVQQLPLCQMVKKMIETFRMDALKPIMEFPQLLIIAADLMVSVVKQAICDDEETWYLEIFDCLLDAWTALTYQVMDLPEFDHWKGKYMELLTMHGYRVFEEYLKARTTAVDEDAETGAPVLSFADEDLYDEQLMSMSLQARTSGPKALNLLNSILSDKARSLATALAQSNYSDTDRLFDEIHWSVLISGFVIADSAQGENPMIPDCWMNGHADEDLLQNVSSMFRLLDIYNNESRARGTTSLSPLVIGTIFWYLDRWSRSYLIFDKSEVTYSNISPALVSAFGSPSAVRLLEMSISQIQAALSAWNSDIDVCKSTAKFIESLAYNKYASETLMNMPAWIATANAIIQNIDQMPTGVHSNLVECMSLIAAGSPSSSHQYYQVLFQTVAGFHTEIVLTLQSNRSSSFLLAKTQNVIDMFTGLAASIKNSNVQVVFPFFRSNFDSFNSLLDVNVLKPQIFYSILEFWKSLVCSLSMLHMPGNEWDFVLKYFTDSVSKYLRHQNQFEKRHGEDGSSQDQVFIILSTLRALIMSEDVSFTEETSKNNTHDAILLTFKLVMPLVDSEMLKIPDIISYYIELVNSICRKLPQKLESLTDKEFESLVKAVEFGIQHTTYDVANFALDSLCCLISFYKQLIVENRTGTAFGVRISHAAAFLTSQLVSHLVYESFDNDLINVAVEKCLSLTLECNADILKKTLETLMMNNVNVIAAAKPRIQQDYETLLTAIDAVSRSANQSNSRDRQEISQQFSRRFFTWLIYVKSVVCLK